MADILTIAQQVQDMMETRTRDNGDRFVCLKDGAPDWMGDLMHAAHGDMVPDDWRYRFIEASIDAIVDAEGDEDNAREIAEEPDVYTSDLTAWLDSRNDRVYYLTEALEEGGDFNDGFRLLAFAQYREKSEVFGLVWQYLADMAEEEEDEEEAE